jgi:O-antigen/teichoic acid export membrane protein
MWRYADGTPVPFVMSYRYTFIVFAVPIAVFFLVPAPWYIALAIAVGVFVALSVLRGVYMASKDAKMMREIKSFRNDEGSKP